MLTLKTHHQSSGDVLPAIVKAALAQRGLTLAALARRHGKEASYFRSALQKPFPGAMKVLARTLAQPPHELWPSLFDEDNRPIKHLEEAESNAPATIRGGKKNT